MTLYCKNGIIEVNFNICTVSAIVNPFNHKYSRTVLSRFKDNLLRQHKIMKFEKKKTLFLESFRVGNQQTILGNFSGVFFDQKDADLVDLDSNYLSTKMTFACLESIKQTHWIEF
jgi:hypothetical protein